MDGDIRFYFAILSTLCNLTEKSLSPDPKWPKGFSGLSLSSERPWMSSPPSHGFWVGSVGGAWVGLIAAGG